MAGFEQWLKFPDSFDGTVRLFPLPETVLFPCAVLPLRLFEPRYVEMMQDALAGDELITMASLSPGWEPDYLGRPPVEETVCVGRVLSHAREEDGSYNLLLLGLQRARLRRELAPLRSFRQAEVELLADVYPADGDAARPELQSRLYERFRSLVPSSVQLQSQFEQFVNRNMRLGQLTDVMSFTLRMSCELKQTLLTELNVDQRAHLLLESMGRARAGSEFPPKFSAN